MSEQDRIRTRYEAHHRDRRDDGEFVFVPERVPLPFVGSRLRLHPRLFARDLVFVARRIA